MLSRNRLFNAAVGGCLVLGVVLSALVGQIGEGKAQGNPDAVNEDGQRMEHDAPPKRHGVIHAVVYQPNCEWPGDHDAADYCQQKRMADAAADTLWWTRALITLTILEIAALLAAVMYTASAAIQAIKGNKIARESQRPWLSIEEVSAANDFVSREGNNIQIDVSIRLRNTGKTPAVNVRTACEIAPVDTKNYNAALQAFSLAPFVGEDFNKHVVFPDSLSDDGWRVTITKTYIDAAPHPYNSERKFILPQLMVCVRYQAPEDDKVHRTAMLFHIGIIYIDDDKICARKFERSPWAKNIAD